MRKPGDWKSCRTSFTAPFLFVLCALCVSAVQIPCAGGELLSNPGFEGESTKEALRDWVAAPGAVEVVTEPALVRSGARAARIVPRKDVLAVALPPRSNGRASVWAKGTGTLTLRLGSAEKSFPLSADWQEFFLLGVKEPKDEKISFTISLTGEGASACLDDASVLGIPVRISAISLVWDAGYRTLDNTLRALDEAALSEADIACLPEDCVETEGEKIPGPVSERIAAKARQYQMHVIANLKERDGAKTHHTSILFDRAGNIVGRYRKSHRLPYEKMDLGDEILVFQTDFGPIGMIVGTDHYFQDILLRMRQLGARTIFWSTTPFPVRDEYPADSLVRARCTDIGFTYVVAQYAGRKGYGGYNNTFAWTATWPLGRACVVDRNGHTVADSGHMGGVATAILPASDLQGTIAPRGSRVATKPVPTPDVPDVKFSKRWARVSLIESGPSFEEILSRIDLAAAQGADIIGLGEYVWYNTEDEVVKYRERNLKRLDALAEKARQRHVYIVVAGELVYGYNEAYIYDRQGKELGRFTKILQTTPKEWKTYKAGKETPVFLTDFGRIAVKICNDTNGPFIDYDYGLKRADLVFFPTMDAGPHAEWRELRHRRRCIDNGFYMASTNYPHHSQSDNRSFIMDPWGYNIAASICTSPEGQGIPPRDAAAKQSVASPLTGIISAVIDFERRPKYFEPPPEGLACDRGGAPAPEGIELSPPPGQEARLRITEREPGGQIDLICLRADGKSPSDQEYRAGKWPEDVICLRACDFKAEESATDIQGGRWEKKADAQALSGFYMVSSGHSLEGPSVAQLTYAVPGLRKAGRWQVWTRVIFPDEFHNSFYWQLSADGGRTWAPSKPCEAGAIGWKVCKNYEWVAARSTQKGAGKPTIAADLREVIFKQRRPELYAAPW